jgi:hypothetical protein
MYHIEAEQLMINYNLIGTLWLKNIKDMLQEYHYSNVSEVLCEF